MTMKYLIVAAFGLPLIGVTVAQAACTDEIAKVEQRLKARSDAAISASSSGQGLAGAREGTGTNTPDKGAKAPGPSDGAADKGKSANAGAGADSVMQAKVKLNDAYVMKGKGDEPGCLKAVQAAQALLGN